MSLESASMIDADEDTAFADEEAASAGAAKVAMPSLELLSSSTVNYTSELIGSQFKILGNTRASATSNCGCGTSFDVVGCDGVRPSL